MRKSRQKLPANPPKAVPRRQSDPVASTRGNVGIYVVLFLATSLLYSASRQFDFVSLDDPADVASNPHVRSGLTAQGLEWAVTSGEYSNWFPLTRLSHLVDSELFGLESGLHHLTNVLFHVLATLALFAFLFRATRDRWPSAFVAAMFALHPLHVESVAWITERKDVLCAFFWFATLWAYVRYAERPERRRYVLTLLLFCLGLMSKPMIVTLPFVLLLLDVWPLRRLAPWSVACGSGTPEPAPIRWSDAFREKIPFFFLSVASSVITYFVQKTGGALQSDTLYPLWQRVQNAVVTYMIYIAKTIWPSSLAVLYPYPRSFPIWQVTLACAVILAGSALVFFRFRSRPYLTVGWLWYLGTLVPVIGLVQVGVQARADRYMYLPMTGLAIMLAWGMTEVLGQLPRFRTTVAVLAGAVLISWATVTGYQLRYWKNSLVLYQHALDVTQRNSKAHYYLGSDLIHIPGRLQEGIAHLEVALQIGPEDANIHTNLAGAFSQMPDGLPRAVEHYEAAVRLRPNSADTQLNLGITLARLPGRLPEAISHLETSLRIRPDDQTTRQALRHFRAVQP